MRQILILGCILLLQSVANAQLLDHMFGQNAKQKKYLAEQIAALQLYRSYMSKGYSLIKDGTRTISSIKNGELSLHDGYFKSLASVNPAIGKSGRVQHILRLQSEIMVVSKKTKAQINAAASIKSEEKQYFRSVYERLLADCDRTLDDLASVTSSGKLEMEDDERIRRIDELYTRSLSQYQFANRFRDDINQLLIVRKQESSENDRIKSFYNITK